MYFYFLLLLAPIYQYFVFVLYCLYTIYTDKGIVKLSLRSQFIARKCIFHCNGLEGFNIENESKLWLDDCRLLNSCGAGIHVNTGCKCLLTQTN